MIVYKIVEKENDLLGPYNKRGNDLVGELPNDMLYEVGVLNKYQYGPGAAFSKLEDAKYYVTKYHSNRNLLIFKCEAKKLKSKTLWNPYYDYKTSPNEILSSFAGIVLCSEITLIEQVYDNKA